IFITEATENPEQNYIFHYGNHGNKRIVLVDKLIEQANTEEILAILAGELFRWKYFFVVFEVVMDEALFFIAFVIFVFIYNNEYVCLFLYMHFFSIYLLIIIIIIIIVVVLFLFVIQKKKKKRILLSVIWIHKTNSYYWTTAIDAHFFLCARFMDVRAQFCYKVPSSCHQLPPFFNPLFFSHKKYIYKKK
ncbi:hypothetical protein RFI_15689, partial [Reticulomyxa filosa]